VTLSPISFVSKMLANAESLSIRGYHASNDLQPGEGFEPPTRALRKRCSLSQAAPRGPSEAHFISENGPGRPAPARLGSPSADNLVGNLSAAIRGAGETPGPAVPTHFMQGQLPSATDEDYEA